MPRFQRPCLVCRALTTNPSRCDRHQAEYERNRAERFNTPQRKLKKKMLYGGDYQRRRREALANATHCYICKERFVEGDRVEADHVISGDPNSPLLPAHRLCNQRKG